MNVIEAMEARHSVRSYQNKPIEEENAKRWRSWYANAMRKAG